MRSCPPRPPRRRADVIAEEFRVVAALRVRQSVTSIAMISIDTRPTIGQRTPPSQT